MAMRGSKPGERRGGRQKGTPNKANGELRAAAREYTDEALLTLATIMRTSESDQAKTAAATALLDRGWGKPHQTAEVTLDDKRDSSEWSTEELLAILDDARESRAGGSEAEGSPGQLN